MNINEGTCANPGIRFEILYAYISVRNLYSKKAALSDAIFSQIFALIQNLKNA